MLYFMNDSSGGKTREASKGVEYDFYLTEYVFCPVWSRVLIFTHCPPELSFFDRKTSEALGTHHLHATVTMATAEKLRQRSNGLKICLPAVFYMYVLFLHSEIWKFNFKCTSHLYSNGNLLIKYSIQIVYIYCMLVREIWKCIHPRVSYSLRATSAGNMIHKCILFVCYILWEDFHSSTDEMYI
jgi:hypothetical protein